MRPEQDEPGWLKVILILLVVIASYAVSCTELGAHI
jgi:hypothetical protein